MDDDSREGPTPSERGALSVRRRVVFSIITVALVLVAVEILCRIGIYLQVIPVSPYRSLREAWNADGWRADDVLCWRLVPGFDGNMALVDVRLNELGQRDEPLSTPKPPGEFRILSVGDSTAFGFGVARTACYATRLETALAQKLRRPVQVINAGVPGYSSVQCRLYLENVGFDFDPNLVIIETNFNDRRAVPAGGAPDSAEYFAHIARQAAAQEWPSRSALVRVLRDGLGRGLSVTRDYSFKTVAIDAKPRVSLDAYTRNIRAMVEDCESRGVAVVLVGLPDFPYDANKVRRARRLMQQEHWDEATQLLRKVIADRYYAIIAQWCLNEIDDRTGGQRRTRQEVDATLNWTGVDGYTPVELCDRYLDVLHEIGRDFRIPVVVPRAPPTATSRIYMDYIHLNEQGHALLAEQLTQAVLKSLELQSPGTSTSPPQARRTAVVGDEPVVRSD